MAPTDRREGGGGGGSWQVIEIPSGSPQPWPDLVHKLLKASTVKCQSIP